ncbi:unnamed protein product [Rhodiola kirilowii]
MANVIMASSSKALIPISARVSKPKSPQFQLSLPKFQTLAPKIPKSHVSISSNSVKSLIALAAATASLTFAPPSDAAEIAKAALFDFNLTLPIMMAEFLFLMFALDKLYYSPLGKFMDERDSMIKGKLSEVKDTSAEIKAMEEQMAAIMRAARAEISAALNKMKKETTAEVEQKIAEGRKKVEAELQEALANLQKQKEETIKALDSQIAQLSEDIVKKVLPI